MAVRSQRYRKQLESLGDQRQAVSLEEGVRRVLEMAKVRVSKNYQGGRKRKGFDQSIELVVHLGIDPKQADQMVRGSVALPKGVGKSKRVIAFCDAETAPAAKEAGAVEAGGEELVKKVADGWLDFDVAVAHPRLMGAVGKLGRVLGPQGKMPSPKSGTVAQDVVTAVREFGAGKLGYRNDAGGNVHAVVGRASFSPEDLKVNIEVFLEHLRKIKPPSAKGAYLKRVCLAGTMTPSVTLAVS